MNVLQLICILVAAGFRLRTSAHPKGCDCSWLWESLHVAAGYSLRISTHPKGCGYIWYHINER